LKRDYKNDKLDCFEARLEEIINICTSTTGKYRRTQRNISARRRRTELFQNKKFQEQASILLSQTWQFSIQTYKF
jgi:hypothetical protein